MAKKKTLKEVPGPKRSVADKIKDPMSQNKWWAVDDAEEAARLITGNIEYWRVNQQRRIRDYILYARLYGTAQLGWFGGLSKLSTMRRPVLDPLLATKNIIQSIVDTSSSKVASNKTKPLFQTSDGEWSAQKRCKERNKFIKGLFEEQKTYELARLAFRDSGVFGDGFIQVYNCNGKVTHERVYPGELYVDEGEAIISDPGHLPRELHRVKVMDRVQLVAMFPDKEKEILEAPGATIDQMGGLLTLANTVEVHESWRLPSTPTSKDGRHFMSVGEHALTDMEVWKSPRYPFARVVCLPRLFGYFSQSLVETLANQQLQYDTLSYSINEAIELAGRFKVWLPTAANLNPSHLTNEIGMAFRSDQPPQFLLTQAVQSEVYERLDAIEQGMYNQAGISQMQANATIPEGMEDASGIAIREHDDIATQRFAIWGESYQEMMLEVARISVDTVQQIIEQQKEDGEEQTYVIHTIGDKMSEDLDWADLAFEEDEQYVITCYPVSELPDTPEGKLAFATNLSQLGFYDEATLRSILQFPDVDRVENLYNSAMDKLNMQLCDMIEKGEVVHPEPSDNLNMAKNLAIQYLNYGQVRSVPEHRLDVIRQYIQEVGQMLQAAMPPPGPATALPPGAPPVPVQPSPLVPQPSGAPQ